MCSTIYRQAAEDAVEKRLQEHPADWAPILVKTMLDLNRAREYPPPYVDVLEQRGFGQFDLVDAYSFLQLHCALRETFVAVAAIPLGLEPGADKKAAEMNSKLAALPEWCRAQFWGGTQDADGEIELLRPIHGVVQDSTDNGLVSGFVIIPDMTFPLEVGSVCIHKMVTYLSIDATASGVARWPYGQDYITILSRHFVTVGDERFTGYQKRVFGSFETLPNILEVWDKQWRAARAKRRGRHRVPVTDTPGTPGGRE